LPIPYLQRKKGEKKFNRGKIVKATAEKKKKKKKKQKIKTASRRKNWEIACRPERGIVGVENR